MDQVAQFVDEGNMVKDLVVDLIKAAVKVVVGVKGKIPNALMVRCMVAQMVEVFDPFIKKLRFVDLEDLGNIVLIPLF